MFFQTVEKLDESELVYSFLISVGQYYRSVDFRSRRFAFRGRIMKKPKCRLFHKQILLGAGAEPPRRFAPAGSHLSSCARRSLRAFHSNQQGFNNLSMNCTFVDKLKGQPTNWLSFFCIFFSMVTALF
jgi:hypothetical protein